MLRSVNACSAILGCGLRRGTMALFNLTVDDPNGFNTAFFFAANLAVQEQGAGSSPVGTANSSYSPIFDGVVDNNKVYRQDFTGVPGSFSITAGDDGVEGTITSATFSKSIGGGALTQLAHLDIVLGSNTGLNGGVHMTSSFFTAEDLLRESVRIDTNG